jgi:hypothetical protein
VIGGGVIAFPLLCILGFYWFARPIPKVICLILALAWMGRCVVVAAMKAEWNILIFPAIVGIGWWVLHSMLKDE